MPCPVIIPTTESGADPVFPPSQRLLPTSRCLGFPWMLSRLLPHRPRSFAISTPSFVSRVAQAQQHQPGQEPARTHSLGRASTCVLTSPITYEPRSILSRCHPSLPISAPPTTQDFHGLLFRPGLSHQSPAAVPPKQKPMTDPVMSLTPSLCHHPCPAPHFLCLYLCPPVIRTASPLPPEAFVQR